MHYHSFLLACAAFAVLFLGQSMRPGSALAHCDGMDGPVVTAARAALQSGDVNRVLLWVKPEAEPEIRAAFRRTMAVRKSGGEARELADLYLFETLVRLHRAGEGAPYTGLKPAGRDLGPAIPAADKALEAGTVDPVVQLLTRDAEKGLRERFDRVRSRKSFAPADVAAGREYVEAYVDYIHYVEGLHQASLKAAHEHEGDAAESARDPD